MHFAVFMVDDGFWLTGLYLDFKISTDHTGGSRGGRDGPHAVNFFHFHAAFGKKLCQIIGLLRPSGKSWIRH